MARLLSQLPPIILFAAAVGAVKKDAAAFIIDCTKLGTSEAAVETAEKKGFNTGLVVTHPLDPSLKLPVYIANFVLMEYGTEPFLAVRRMTSAILILPMPMACQCGQSCCLMKKMRVLSPSPIQPIPVLVN